MSYISLDEAARITVVFYAFSFVLDCLSLLALYKFRPIFTDSSIAKIIATIHFYDALNGITYLVTYQCRSESFRCYLMGISTNIYQLCVSVWVCILCIKLNVIIQPKKIGGLFFKSNIWEDVASNIYVQISIFLFFTLITLILLVRYRFTRSFGWCWIDENETSFDQYITWTILTNFAPVALLCLLSIILSIRSFYYAGLLTSTSLFTRWRFKRLLIYPLSSALWGVATLLQTDLIDSNIPIFVEAIATAGYGFGFFLIFKRARYALWLHFVDLVSCSSVDHSQEYVTRHFCKRGRESEGTVLALALGYDRSLLTSFNDRPASNSNADENVENPIQKTGHALELKVMEGTKKTANGPKNTSVIEVTLNP